MPKGQSVSLPKLQERVEMLESIVALMIQSGALVGHQDVIDSYLAQTALGSPVGLDMAAYQQAKDNHVKGG